MSKEAKAPKVFAVYSRDGKLEKLVEAQTKAQVQKHLLDGRQITVPSALTVARAGMTVEKAQ